MLLILREEILCLIILSFLLFYYGTNKLKESGQHFPQVISFGTAHVLFDIFTVLAVNSQGIVPDHINRVLHIMFYITGIAFGSSFYSYVIHLCSLYKLEMAISRFRFVPMTLFIGMLLSFPMEYTQGNGTNYSSGLLTYTAYAIFLVYCAICVGSMIYSWKRIDTRLRYALFPLVPFVCGLIILQALIPEMLMTSGVVTLICVAMFVALDNPDKKYKEQAMWDFLTGLKSRNSYDRDIKMYTERYGVNNKRRIGFIVADLNNLKTINDNYGHVEGDRLLTAAAEAMRKNLVHADHIYRIGGDEFVALYLSPDDLIIVEEMEKVRQHCLAETGFPVPLEIAMGYYADIAHGSLEPIFNEADRLMYENKKFMKQKKHPTN